MKKLLPLLLLTCTAPAFSWSVSRLSKEINSNKTKEYTITVNAAKDDRSIPIEVFIGQRTIDEEGNDNYEKIDDHDFFVYPSVFVLQPGLSQKVRVRYTGDLSALKQEQVYRIGVGELPTKPKSEETPKEGVQIGLALQKKFIGSIYVSPKKARSDVNTVSSHIQHKGDDDFLHLTLENKGSKRKHFRKPLCTLSTKDRKISFKPDVQGNKHILLLGGQQRNIHIQLPPDWKEKLGNDQNVHIELTDESD